MNQNESARVDYDHTEELTDCTIRFRAIQAECVTVEITPKSRRIIHESAQDGNERAT